MDWRILIAKNALLKSKINEADINRVWSYHLPSLAATQEQVERFQEKIRRKVPEEYLSFLKCANGWKGFFQNNDLLGTADTFSKDCMDLLNSEFYNLRDVSIDNISKSDLFPIGVNYTDKDIFFLVLSQNEYYGKVIWFAGEEIQRFENFSDFFSSMIAYNERELAKLEASKK